MSYDQLELLTPREREILSLIAEGDSLPDIARKLHRSLKTIESHRLSLGRKLSANNRVELARIAIAAGLVSIGDASQSTPNTDPESEARLELKWLSQISEAVHNVTGRRYIDRLCCALSRVLGVRYAAVCIANSDTVGDSRLAISFSENGEPGKSFTYDAANKPAQTVLEQGVCSVLSDIRSAYPQDDLFRELGVDSYLGIRLDRGQGISSGIIAISDMKPMAHAEAFERILRFFASRTLAELELVHKAEQMYHLQSQLGLQVLSRQVYPHAGSSEKSESDLKKLSFELECLAGSRYLAALTNTLCAMLGVSHAGVCINETREDEPEFVTLCVSEQGVQVDNMRYQVRDTPCESVVNEGFFCQSGGLIEAFPEDRFLADLGIHAYCGVRLIGYAGTTLGVIWVINTQPFENPQRIEQFLRYLAPRTGAEVEVVLQMEELSVKCERLEKQLVKLQAELVKRRSY